MSMLVGKKSACLHISLFIVRATRIQQKVLGISFSNELKLSLQIETMLEQFRAWAFGKLLISVVGP